MERLNGDEGEYYSKKGFYYLNCGYMKKAAAFLLDSLFSGNKNSDILNAAGLMLFYLGDINNAIRLFRLNVKENLDTKSKQYIQKIDEIKNYVDDFNKSIEMVKSRNYKRGFDKLYSYYIKGCITEDGLKLLVLCCIKLKKYTFANEVIDKMHNINKECDFYYNAKSYTSRVNEKKHKRLNKFSVSFALACVFISLFMEYQLTKKPKEIVNIKVVKEEVNTKENKMPEFMYFMLQKDYLNVEKIKEYIDINSLSEEHRDIYKILLSKYEYTAAKYFYVRGLEYYRNGVYRKSAECFRYAYKYKRNDYLDRHILFLLSKSLKNIKDPLAIGYYKEFIDSYKDGCYVEEALYDAALLYFESGNIKKAKEYAERLIIKYDKSMYINGKIKGIINYRGD